MGQWASLKGTGFIPYINASEMKTGFTVFMRTCFGMFSVCELGGAAAFRLLDSAQSLGWK
jgi:hypothetical protein